MSVNTSQKTQLACGVNILIENWKHINVLSQKYWSKIVYSIKNWENTFVRIVSKVTLSWTTLAYLVKKNVQPVVKIPPPVWLVMIPSDQKMGNVIGTEDAFIDTVKGVMNINASYANKISLLLWIRLVNPPSQTAKGLTSMIPNCVRHAEKDFTSQNNVNVYTCPNQMFLKVELWLLFLSNWLLHNL